MAGLPRDASSEDFCASFEQLATDLGAFSPDADPVEPVGKMQDASTNLRETGVPENATDQQAEGLEITLDAIDGIDGIDPDASLADLGNLEDQFSEAEQEKADAFDDYLDEECGEIG